MELKPGKLILVVVLCLLLILTGVFGPGIYRGVKMVGMVSELWNQMDSSLDIQINETMELRLDWTETQLGRVMMLESSGVAVYYRDGVIYLENGKGYDFSDTVAPIVQLLQSPWKLYPLVKTSREGKNWTAAMEEPSFVVTLEQGDSGIEAVRAAYHGTEIAAFPRPERSVESVPDDVLDAMASGKTQGGGDLTKALLRLFAAGANLNSRDTLAMDLNLTADCGPLTLADTLQIDTDRESGISYVEKNGRGLYFSRNKICTSDGKLVTGGESTVESAQLLGAAYLLLLNGDFTCENDTYRLTLDQAGMERFAYTIAPAAENLNVAFQSGEIVLNLSGNALQSLSVSCAGTLDLILTNVDVAIGADLTLKEAGEFVIPQTVRDVLS